MTKEELKDIVIPDNFVLFKLDRGNDEVILGEGDDQVKLFVPINIGNQEVHAPVTGEVIKVCEFVGHAGSQAWETDVEVSEGDKAVVYYLDVVKALGGYRADHTGYDRDNRLVVVKGDDGEDEAYVFLQYDSFYCVLRNEEVIPVNGYVLGTLIDAQDIEGSFGAIDANGRKLKQQMVVKHVGSPVSKYRMDSDQFEQTSLESIDLEVGDIVYVEHDHYLAPLESDMHSVLEKGLVYIQRRHIVAKLSEPVQGIGYI